MVHRVRWFSGSVSPQLGQFICAQMTPFAGLQTLQRHSPDPFTHKAQRGVADRRGHASDLSVSALSQRESYPGSGHAESMANRGDPLRQIWFAAQQLDTSRTGHAVFQHDAGREPRECFVACHALDLNKICARMTKPRVSNPGREIPVIGQQEKSFAVKIEPTDWVHVGEVYELGQGPPSLVISKFRQHPVGLPERQ